MKDTIRSFIAFELPEPVVRLAADLQAGLKSHGLKLRWIRPQNIHLTLKFFGDIKEIRIAKAVEAMEKSASNIASIAVTAQGLGVFPGVRKARVLWFGLGGQIDLLCDAQRLLEDELEERGFSRERRLFKPHLTLARIKQVPEPHRLQKSLQDVGVYHPVEFQLAVLTLFKSELRPQGASYTPLHSVPLGSA